MTDAEIEAAWLPFFVAGVAFTSALLAGLAAGQNGAPWWIWVPIGALLPFIPTAIVRFLEATLLVDTEGSPLQWCIASTACAALSGYLAWSKRRTVWLWTLLGAVSLYVALVIIAFRPHAEDSPLEEMLSAPGRSRALRGFRRPRPPKASLDEYEQWIASARSRDATAPPGSRKASTAIQPRSPGARAPRPTRPTDPLSAFLSRARKPSEDETRDS